MNILILTPSFFPKRGGTEQVIYELTSRLKNLNNITILTSRLENKWKKFENFNGINIFRVRLSQIKGLRLYINYLTFFFVALKLNKIYKFDLTHMFHAYDCGGTAYLIKKVLKIPLLITLGGWDTYDPIRKIPKRHIPFVRIAMNVSNLITAPSQHLADAGKKQDCKKEIIVIPHGSSMHEKVNLKHADIKSLHNIKNKKLILSVQRLHPRKGLEYLLEAVPNIISQRKDLVFVIVGKGPEEENLKTLADKLRINNHVIFTGFISDNDLPSYYAASDLFVLPTLYEAFGLVYIDALCFGVPIVTTENGGSLDIINKENGILVPAKDPDKLGKAIIKALYKNWDKGAIKAGVEKYRWENIVEKYMKLYRSVTDK